MYMPGALNAPGILSENVTVSFDATKHKWSDEEFFNPPYDKVGRIDEIPASALKAFATSVYDLSSIPVDTWKKKALELS